VAGGAPVSVKGQEAGIKHGTRSGYKQHLYREVPACEACLQAERGGGERKQRTSAPKTVKPEKKAFGKGTGMPGGVSQTTPVSAGPAESESKPPSPATSSEPPTSSTRSACPMTSWPSPS
jgi:hypothetical protein